MKTPVRIILVDDHALVREGLRRLIENEPGMEVAAEAASAEVALVAARQCRPDVAIVDIFLPGISGIELTSQILAQCPDCRVLILSAYEETVYPARAFRAGARGYVMKHEDAKVVVEAIRRVAGGEFYLGPQLQQHTAQLLAGLPVGKAEEMTAVLTDRELEILSLIGQGYSALQIAEKLHRSVKTVNAHRQALKQKLRMLNTSNLTAFAVRWVQGQNFSASGARDSPQLASMAPPRLSRVY